MNNKLVFYVKIIAAYFLIESLLSFIPPLQYSVGNIFHEVIYQNFHITIAPPQIIQKVASMIVLLLTAYGLWNMKRYGYYLALAIFVIVSLLNLFILLFGKNLLPTTKLGAEIVAVSLAIVIIYLYKHRKVFK